MPFMPILRATILKTHQNWFPKEWWKNTSVFVGGLSSFDQIKTEFYWANKFTEQAASGLSQWSNKLKIWKINSQVLSCYIGAQSRPNRQVISAQEGQCLFEFFSLSSHYISLVYIGICRKSVLLAHIHLLYINTETYNINILTALKHKHDIYISSCINN